MNTFATLDDVKTLWRPLTAEEQTRAEALLSVVSNSLRYEAHLLPRPIGKCTEKGKGRNLTKNRHASCVSVFLLLFSYIKNNTQ